jgi:hypothetical protein
MNVKHRNFIQTRIHNDKSRHAHIVIHAGRKYTNECSYGVSTSEATELLLDRRVATPSVPRSALKPASANRMPGWEAGAAGDKPISGLAKGGEDAATALLNTGEVAPQAKSSSSVGKRDSNTGIR